MKMEMEREWGRFTPHEGCSLLPDANLCNVEDSVQQWLSNFCRSTRFQCTRNRGILGKRGALLGGKSVEFRDIGKNKMFSRFEYPLICGNFKFILVSSNSCQLLVILPLNSLCLSYNLISIIFLYVIIHSGKQ